MLGFRKMKHNSFYTAVLNKAAYSSAVTAASANVQDFHLQPEALYLLAPYMTHWQVHITFKDSCNMLTGGLV